VYSAHSTNGALVALPGGLIEVICQAMDSIGVALVITDRQARVRTLNTVARRLVGGSLLRVDDLRLLGHMRADTVRLHTAIEAVTLADGEGPRSILLQGLDSSDAHPASVAPLSLVSPGESERLALIAVAAPRAAIEEDRLRQTFSLTPAETRLLSALVTGERLADYAERTGVKRSTAKTHLRGLFHKVGEARQADLIRRVMGDAQLQAPNDHHRVPSMA
jgi:DNA-binding CsgD family transcriptional regulator